jgi:hypothetical protein
MINPGHDENNWKFPNTLVDSLNVSVSAGIIVQNLKN